MPGMRRCQRSLLTWRSRVLFSEQEEEGRSQLASWLVGQGWFSKEEALVPVDLWLLGNLDFIKRDREEQLGATVMCNSRWEEYL